MFENNLYVALIHYPVINRNAETIGSALTTIDLHDIARACMTFGVKGFYVVTPYSDQADLAHRIMGHWTTGTGGRLNPDRKNALSLVRVTESLEQTVSLVEKERNEPVVTIATSAKQSAGSIGIGLLRQKLNDTASHVLVFGTAWGLAEKLIASCNYVLDPINGHANYNHLSVRSAVSIYLDRIVNGR